MSETRKIAAILVSDVVGYSRLAGADEDRTLARLRALRSDLIDPTISVHHGRIVKRTGDGSVIEFRSVVDAVRCALEVQHAMVERNAGVALDKRIEFRIGIHLGDVVEESDGDLMGDGVNIAARLEGIAKAGAICLSEDAYRQVSGRLDMEVTDLGQTELKNIERSIRVYSLQVGVPAQAKPVTEPKPPDFVQSATDGSLERLVGVGVVKPRFGEVIFVVAKQFQHLRPSPYLLHDFLRCPAGMGIDVFVLHDLLDKTLLDQRMVNDSFPPLFGLSFVSRGRRSLSPQPPRGCRSRGCGHGRSEQRQRVRRGVFAEV